ncbi:MAG: sodium/proton-translocating pyrophosphatase, partial [Muribaculaceae bacterium]|nr:sodium/proton-translocating pyrophosphatase [Muribaculaceae bacterium]
MKKLLTAFSMLLLPATLLASEADLKMPENFSDKASVLYWGFAVVVLGLLFGFWQFLRVKKLKSHASMLEIGDVIFKTCSTYLKQQGKFLGILFLFIGAAVVLYFGLLSKMAVSEVALILGWTVIGVLGSYAVAWFGVRMNTYANSRMAFASLRRRPLDLLNIPLTAGMSIGIVLICVELVLMLVILLFMGDLAGACFIGFAIGESLGASALRIAGGIFTKIADIGSDLMKVVFKIGEDDPRNPGVIADCTGDNAGDSIGPTADGFETYGVTGVALVSFILLAVPAEYQVSLLVWIFVMRILGVVASVVSYYINGAISKARYSNADDLDFEKPLTSLVWITSILSIAATYAASY